MEEDRKSGDCTLRPQCTRRAGTELHHGKIVSANISCNAYRDFREQSNFSAPRRWATRVPSPSIPSSLLVALRAKSFPELMDMPLANPEAFRLFMRARGQCHLDERLVLSPKVFVANGGQLRVPLWN